MPQAQLPLFPEGIVHINSYVGYERRGDYIVYFNGHLPMFTHRADDVASFRLITSQLLTAGTITQGDIVKAFNVPLTTVKRYSKKLRQEGVGAFFKPAPPRRGHKLTPERLMELQPLLDQGLSVPQISARSGVLASTLHKALGSGRLKKKPLPPVRPRPAKGPAARANEV